MISTQPRSARRGFSLIEVAIALVIFVIGALAIIRIFPGALNVIGNNGNQQIAMNLNREVKSRLKTDGSVPGQTFNIAVNDNGTLQWTTAANTNHTVDYTNPNNPNSGDIAASVIGVPRFNASLPTSEDINTQSGQSALSRFRGIIGEQGKVFQLGNDYYTETQFPISLEKINGGTKDVLLPPTISQEYTVQNARINKQGQVSFEDATLVDAKGIVRSLTYIKTITDTTDPDYGKADDLPAGSMLYISYRYHVVGGNVWSVKEEAVPVTTVLSLTVPANPPITVNPPTTTRGARSTYDSNNPTITGAKAEPIDVRVKRLVGIGAFGPANSPNFGDVNYPTIEQVTEARCGLVRLPAPLSTAVSIDYVADWSWLLQRANLVQTPDEERPPITNYSYRQIALGAPLIEDQAPIGVYSLLQDPRATDPLYLSRFGTDNATPDPTVGNSGLITPTEDELRAGKLTFSIYTPSGTDTTNIEPKTRVAYRTRDSWVQQLSVAATAYKPWVANDAEPWRDYYLGGDNYLYFHASEAGKTISISYITRESNGVAIVDPPIVNRPFVIDTQIIDTPTNSPANVPADFTTAGKVSRVKLTDSNGVNLPDNPNLPTTIADPPNLLSLQGINGSSVTVRAAYINGNKYAQTLLTSNRGTN